MAASNVDAPLGERGPDPPPPVIGMDKGLTPHVRADLAVGDHGVAIEDTSAAVGEVDARALPVRWMSSSSIRTSPSKRRS
jgi:hypothetical protein